MAFMTRASTSTQTYSEPSLRNESAAMAAGMSQISVTSYEKQNAPGLSTQGARLTGKIGSPMKSALMHTSFRTQ
jgi:hypothetical protein